MDILIIGSSQMEGTNVPAAQRTSVVLESLTGKSVYNVGTAGHTFLTCVQNLEAALEHMQPTEYVIIETASTGFEAGEIGECIAGERAELSSYDSGLLFQMQKIPYLKLVYAQLKSWDGIGGNAAGPESSAPVENKYSKEAYMDLAARISGLCAGGGVQPIVFFHPQVGLNADGSASASRDPASLELLAEACNANGIIFIDMTEDFHRLYDGQSILPQGFCNTSVNTGHLNRHGHGAIAERLALVIKAQEVGA